jgi:hypothetical protein
MGREQRINAAASGGGGHFTGKHGRIQAWLLGAGWQIGEAQADNAVWVVGAVNPIGHPVAIVQLRQPQDMIVVQASLEFDDAFREQFGTLSGDERAALILEVKLGLLKLGVGFDNGLADPLHRFAVTQTIFDDGLTKDTFFQRVDQVRYGVLLALWTLQAKVGRPPHDNWQDTLNVH